MAAQLEEIALEYSMSSLPRSQIRVDTNCGQVAVTVIGERSNTKLAPLITLHDFGFDHVSQFRTLENSGEEASRFFSQFVTYHIDLPGCEEDAGDITGQYADMDNLPDIITHVRSALNISGAMVLLGVGAGANIAMRYMLKHTRNVLGAILIEVTNDSETWVKWTQDKITDMVMKPTDLVSVRSKTPAEQVASLLDKQFGRRSAPTPILSDCRSYMNERLLTSLNLSNMNLYEHSYYNRKAVPESDFTANTVVPCLIISGRQSWRNDATVDVRAQLQSSKKDITLLEPSPSYLLPLEEATKHCSHAMMLFIQGIGLGLRSGLANPKCVEETYRKVEKILEFTDPVLV